MWWSLTIAVVAAAAVAYAIGRWLAPALDRRVPERLRAEAAGYLRALGEAVDGDPGAARDALSAAARERTDEPELYFALAALHRASGNHERAARIHQSLSVRPGMGPREQARARLELAVDYRRQERVEAAVAEVDAALERAANDPRALGAAAEVYEAAGAWERAAAALGRRVRIGRRDPQLADRIAHLHAEAALVLLGRADPEGARRAVKASPRPAGTGARAHLALARGKVALAGGDAKAAVKLLEAALRAAPAMAEEIWPPLRDALFARGALAQAEPLLRGLAAEDPGRLAVRVCLGRLLAAGAADAAIRELRAVLDADPLFLPARRALSEVLLASAPAAAAGATSNDVRKEYEGLIASLEALLEGGAGATKGLRCGRCGRRALAPAWRCGRCGAWDSLA